MPLIEVRFDGFSGFSKGRRDEVQGARVQFRNVRVK